MYGIFTYICLIFMIHVGKHTIVPWILWDIDNERPSTLVASIHERFTVNRGETFHG